MAITIQNLIDKHSIASKALEEYSSSMADKLATGNFNNSIIHKFNVMSSWMTFLKEKLTPVVAIQGVSPNNIIIPSAPIVTNQETSGQKLTIGIENNLGRYVTIFATSYYGGSASSAQELFLNFSSMVNHDYIDDLNINRGKFSIKLKNATEYEITFPKTSDFNGQSVVYSPNVVNFTSGSLEDTYSTKVNKGVNEVNSGTLITNESKNSYNEILEKIAIELKISY
tara:strand:- start:3121 stop:3798 length:678 start_codon:yes stop_codon:yes gene_type:complete